LDEPVINVARGRLHLAVNGIALTYFPDPWAAFEGLAGKTVELPSIKTILGWIKDSSDQNMDDETRLRNLGWIESNRQTVDKASCGKIGYIYVPDTGTVDRMN
jgi:tricorn protease